MIDGVVPSSALRITRRVTLGLGLLTIASLMLAAIVAAPARADFGVEVFDAAVLDSDGDAFTQAGGHPFEVSTSFDLHPTFDGSGNLVTDGGDLRALELDLPAGFVGNPLAVPACPGPENIMEDSDPSNMCPIESQVGTATFRFGGFAPFGLPVSVPVYNMEPPPGRPAQFGLFAGFFPVFLDPVVRSDGDYGLRVRAHNLSQALIILGSTVDLWGTPADPAHDDQRCPLMNEFAGACLGDPGTPSGPNPYPTTGVAATPLLTNPTRCTDPGVGLESTLTVESWRGDTDSARLESHFPPHYPAPPQDWGDPVGPTGCQDVPFNPSISFEPFNDTADRPTGVAVEVGLPQDGLLNPDGIATAHLKRTKLVLPEGMAISPSAAGGLASCSPEQIGLESKDPVRFNDDDPNCPDASKIGTVRIETPLLEEDLSGDVFVAEQDNNPFDSTFAMYVIAQGSGVTVKLPGEISPDPETGRITTSFDDAPQLPFTTLLVRLKGGSRAPLVNPPTCGTKTVRAELTPWSAADPDDPTSDEIRTRMDSFQVNRGPGGLPCASTLGDRPFSPEMNAGTVNPVAGAFSPFVFQLKRHDGHQEILSTEVEPPEGVVASLRGIPLCSDADANTGNCPAASRVGIAAAATGAGSTPYFVDTGEVFLTGPYKGAPLGLLIRVPAQAGPFDLGMVDVRAAVHVDPQTAQIRVESDWIPQIIEGVPLRIRDIRVLMNREGFTVAPTSCDPKQVLATVNGSHGASANLAEPFQVGECRALGFQPAFHFRAVGRRSTLPNRNPRITAIVRANDDDANISQASVVLPRRMIVDQDNIATTCTREQFAQGQCPEETIMGSATAHSPLLDEPLHGSVYLIASGNPLPDMVADLKGIVDIALFGRIHSQGIRVRNTFDVVPDVPLDRFRLTVNGGPDGILVNGADLCDRPRFRKVDVRVHGQNNDTAHQTRMLQSNRCLRQRAQQLQQRIRNLRHRARQAQSLGHRQRAKRMRVKAQRLERQRQRVLSRL